MYDREGMMHKPDDDPVIDEIRAIRHRISDRVGHDPRRLVAYYIELQKQYEHRLIDASQDPERSFDLPGTLGV